MTGLLRSSVRLGLLTAVAFATCSGARAAEERRAPPSPVSFHGDANAPDIAGIWVGTALGIPGQGVANNSGKTADGRAPAFWSPWPLPYTPEYQKIYDERIAAAKQGRALGDIGSRCLPFGLPMMLSSQQYPEEIIQTPGKIVFFIFGVFPIVVWTDGRPHPANLDTAPSCG